MPLSGAISAQVVFRTDTAKGPEYWANTHEFSAPMGGIATDGQDLAASLALAHRRLLANTFVLDRVVLSTYAPDGQPYNPETMYIYPVGERGLREQDTIRPDVLPLFTVLHVRKLVGSGRLGHLFLRGMLRETDIQSDSNGGVSLSDPVGIQEEVSTAFIDVLSPSPATPRMHLISGSGIILEERQVTGLQVARITSKALRTRRKSRFTANAISTIGGILGDGQISLDEVPALVGAVARIVADLGGPVLPLVPLLPGGNAVQGEGEQNA